MSLYTVFVASGIAVYGVFKCQDLAGVAELVGVFMAAAFGGKVTQKIVESKKDKE